MLGEYNNMATTYIPRSGFVTLRLHVLTRGCLVLMASLLIISCGTIGGEEILFPVELTDATADVTEPEAGAETVVLPEILPFTEDPVRIALLLPLTGAAATTGQALLDAASLALFEAYDPRLTLLPFDTGGTERGAQLAMARALESEPAIILGPLFGSSVRAAAPLARAAGVPVVAFSNDHRVAGEGVYLLSFMPADEVRQIVEHAVEQGYQRIGALIPDTLYGETVLNALSESLVQSGGSLARVEVYPQNPQAMFDPVRRLADYDRRRRAYLNEVAALEAANTEIADEILETLENLETLGDPPFDAVLVPEGGEFLRTLAPLLPFFEVDPAKIKFLGTGLWEDDGLIHEPPMDGAWYASTSVENLSAFRQSFTATYGYEPPRIATLAYDALWLAASLARDEVRSARFSQSVFSNANGFSGIDGPFRFRADGTAERALAIIEIRPAGFRTISPAARSFRPADLMSRREARQLPR